MLALHSLSLSKYLISSHVFSELIASMTNMHVNPLDFALASLAQLSLLRYVAVSISLNHSSNFVEPCLLKMAMSCSREFVRFVCFCVVHSVSMYWHTTPPNGSLGAEVEVDCVLSARRDSVVPILGGQCSPIPQLAHLLCLLLLVVSCLFPL